MFINNYILREIQYDDRIEIMNHGGLYGRANVHNFPKVNDYRNIVIAEAMKVLGFVNRHSRGVLRVQKDLKANENGEAIYDFSYQSAVLVIENKSQRGDKAIEEAIAKGFLQENALIEKSLSSFNKKPSKLAIPEFPSKLVKDVYDAIKLNRKAKYSWLQDNLGVRESTILRAVNVLKKLGYIDSKDSKINGEWQLLK